MFYPRVHAYSKNANHPQLLYTPLLTRSGIARGRPRLASSGFEQLFRRPAIGLKNRHTFCSLGYEINVSLSGVWCK